MNQSESRSRHFETVSGSVILQSIFSRLLCSFSPSAQLSSIFHQEDRRHLRPKHEPGTIASAVSIGAHTGVGEILAGRHDEKGIKEALQNKRFRIDPITMKIIMEGEYGYESATSPKSRRSVFEMMQGHRANRLSVQSAGSKTPPSPESPRTTS